MIIRLYLKNSFKIRMVLQKTKKKIDIKYLLVSMLFHFLMYYCKKKLKEQYGKKKTGYQL
jgi:hypothetical protein